MFSFLAYKLKEKTGVDFMKKAMLESYLQTIVPRNIKICESLTKEELIYGLHKSLLEQQLNNPNDNEKRVVNNPMEKSTIADMYSSAPTFQRTSKDVQGNMKTEPVKGLVNPQAKSPNNTHSGGGFKGDRKSGEGAVYSQRLGIPAIRFEGEYNELSENQMKALGKLFTPEQIEYIYEAPNSSWQSATLKPLYVLEEQLKTGRGSKDNIRIYFDEQGVYFKDVPFGMLNSLYTRSDEGHRTTQYKTGATVIPMVPNDGTQYALPLDDKTAFLLTIPGEDGLFLISMSSQEGNAFFEV
jgi:hypothetical protein